MFVSAPDDDSFAVETYNEWIVIKQGGVNVSPHDD
jgi:hypothetical protein